MVNTDPIEVEVILVLGRFNFAIVADILARGEGLL